LVWIFESAAKEHKVNRRACGKSPSGRFASGGKTVENRHPVMRRTAAARCKSTHYLRRGFRRQRRLAGLAGLVAQQTLDPALGKALLPPPYRRPADADALRHPLRRMPIRRGILFTSQLHADLGVTHVTPPQQAGAGCVQPGGRRTTSPSIGAPLVAVSRFILQMDPGLPWAEMGSQNASR